MTKCQSWLSDLARSNGLRVHEDIREALEDTASLLLSKKAQQRTMTSAVLQPSRTQFGRQFAEDAKIGRLFTISCHQPALFEMLRVSPAGLRRVTMCALSPHTNSLRLSFSFFCLLLAVPCRAVGA